MDTHMHKKSALDDHVAGALAGVPISLGPRLHHATRVRAPTGSNTSRGAAHGSPYSHAVVSAPAAGIGAGPLQQPQQLARSQVLTASAVLPGASPASLSYPYSLVLPSELPDWVRYSEADAASTEPPGSLYSVPLPSPESLRRAKATKPEVRLLLETMVTVARVSVDSSDQGQIVPGQPQQQGQLQAHLRHDH